MEHHRDAFTVSTDPARLDRPFICDFLRHSYWAADVPEPVLLASIDNALCFGLYREARQIGFARVITDYARFAYLADVFIVEAWRGQGLSKWMLACILAHPDLQTVRSWLLTTKDAHGLYAQFGFEPLADPGQLMQRRVRPAYGGGRNPGGGDAASG